MQKPKWHPSSVEEVDLNEVEALFEPLNQGTEELRVWVVLVIRCDSTIMEVISIIEMQYACRKINQFEESMVHYIVVLFQIFLVFSKNGGQLS